MTTYQGDTVALPGSSDLIVGREKKPTPSYQQFFRELWEMVGMAQRAPRYMPLFVPWSAMHVHSSGGPDEVTRAGSILGLGFDASAVESVSFDVLVPHNYREGSDLIPFVLWEATTQFSSTVVWGLDYSIAKVGANHGSPVSISVAGDTAGADRQLLSQFNAIDGDGVERVSVVRCSLYRDATAGADSYSADATLAGAGFLYQAQGAGSVRAAP